jgi:hypothetical protein
MNWVVILAIISFIIGLVNGTTGLKSMRSKESAQAEANWKQPPLSPWRYETPSIIAISIHSLGLVCLTVFVLWSLIRINLFSGAVNANSSILLWTMALLAVFFTTYTSGVMLAYHFAQPWISPVSYGICSDGMLYGGVLVHWKSYSHYEIGPDDGQISLYSSHSPQLRTWVLKPPAELFMSVLGFVRKSLPSVPPADESIRWQRSPFILIVEMLALTVGVLLPIVWGWFQNPSRVWIYAFIAFLFLQYSGIKLITLFDGRGRTARPENIENESYPWQQK